MPDPDYQFTMDNAQPNSPELDWSNRCDCWRFSNRLGPFHFIVHYNQCASPKDAYAVDELYSAFNWSIILAS